MKYIKNFKTFENRYLSDDDIEDSYSDYEIREFKHDKDKRIGFIDIVFPHRESIVDNYIVYDNGKIAFSNWYPEDLRDELKLFIYDHIEDPTIKAEIGDFYGYNSGSDDEEDKSGDFEDGQDDFERRGE